MKILIIEDEIGISNFLKQGLEEENYQVLVAHNGLDGLEMALKQAPDLILLDWMLPKMQGIDVCINIRNSGSQVPILFLTAKDTVQETIDGLKAGANDYIKKPFSFDELLERIKIHFRSAKTNQILTLGSIKIICDKYEVYSNEELVQLTQKEYKLLHYLISNKGIVCSRNQIIEDVWDIHFEYDTGVIDVFMNAIRKKLHLSKDDERLKTIRGIGYIANDY
jgi:DNA-binding response OmpR family regulator